MVSLLQSGNPLSCGGFAGNGTACYEYLHPLRTWQQGPSTLYERVGSAAVEFNEGSYWVAGGFFSFAATISSEVNMNPRTN